MQSGTAPYLHFRGMYVISALVLVLPGITYHDGTPWQQSRHLQSWLRYKRRKELKEPKGVFLHASFLKNVPHSIPTASLLRPTIQRIEVIFISLLLHACMLCQHSSPIFLAVKIR